MFHETNSSPGPFQTRPLTPEDAPMVLRFLREFYYEEEPLSAYLHGVDEEKVRYRDRGLNEVAHLDERLSLVATTPLGQIGAVVLLEGVRYEYEDSIESLPEKNPVFRKIRKLVVEVEKEMDVLVGLFDTGFEEMRLQILCVDPYWKTKRFATSILKQVREVAVVNGFRQIRTVCTCQHTADLLEDFGFHTVYGMNYDSYKENGEVVFKPSPLHAAVRGMIYEV